MNNSHFVHLGRGSVDDQRWFACVHFNLISGEILTSTDKCL